MVALGAIVRRSMDRRVSYMLFESLLTCKGSVAFDTFVPGSMYRRVIYMLLESVQGGKSSVAGITPEL